MDWDDFVRLAGAPVTVALRGRVVAADGAAERVLFAPPDLWRVEDDSGRLRFVADDAGYHTWTGGAPRFHPRRPGYRHSGGLNSIDLIHPRDLAHPVDDDFTRPAGPVTETAFIGRRAWSVLLAAPPHKPHPVRQILDVETGVTLAYETPDGLALVAFTSLTAGIGLPGAA
ncbi:hypothetical protein ACQPZJ_24315 [Actinoplanes sp. CA-054009]